MIVLIVIIYTYFYSSTTSEKCTFLLSMKDLLYSKRRQKKQKTYPSFRRYQIVLGKAHSLVPRAFGKWICPEGSGFETCSFRTLGGFHLSTWQLIGVGRKLGTKIDEKRNWSPYLAKCSPTIVSSFGLNLTFLVDAKQRALRVPRKNGVKTTRNCVHESLSNV